MSSYLIFAIGCFLGTCGGLILAGILGAAHDGEVSLEIQEAYEEGVRWGREDERRDFMAVGE